MRSGPRASRTARVLRVRAELRTNRGRRLPSATGREMTGLALPGHDLGTDAMKLLPMTPAVIVVDDAHRSPADLAILLNYAAENAGTQLLFGVRGLESQAIRTEVIRIGFRQDQIREIRSADFKKASASTSGADEAFLSRALARSCVAGTLTG